MLEPQVKSVPTTCPFGIVGGGPQTIAIRREKLEDLMYIALNDVVLSSLNNHY